MIKPVISLRKIRLLAIPGGVFGINISSIFSGYGQIINFLAAIECAILLVLGYLLIVFVLGNFFMVGGKK